MNAIEKEYIYKGILRGGILLLPAAIALEMVRKCREKNIQILGIDGFLITPTTTQPSMEQSIDFDDPSSDDNWARAECFLTVRANTDLYFEVVNGRVPNTDP
jgi:hypothetical protein